MKKERYEERADTLTDLQKHHKRMTTDPVYRYITNQLHELDYKIEKTKDEIKMLAYKQEEQKRGRAALSVLRRVHVADKPK